MSWQQKSPSLNKQQYWLPSFRRIRCATVPFTYAFNFKKKIFSISFCQLPFNLPGLKFGIWVKWHFNFNGSPSLIDTSCCSVFTLPQASTNITFQIFVKLMTKAPQNWIFCRDLLWQYIIEVTFYNLPKFCANFKTTFPFPKVKNVVSIIIINMELFIIFT